MSYPYPSTDHRVLSLSQGIPAELLSHPDRVSRYDRSFSALKSSELCHDVVRSKPFFFIYIDHSVYHLSSAFLFSIFFCLFLELILDFFYQPGKNFFCASFHGNTCRFLMTTTAKLLCDPADIHFTRCPQTDFKLMMR